jgi:hypothetical protein
MIKKKKRINTPRQADKIQSALESAVSHPRSSANTARKYIFFKNVSILNMVGLLSPEQIRNFPLNNT